VKLPVCRRRFPIQLARPAVAVIRYQRPKPSPKFIRPNRPLSPSCSFLSQLRYSQHPHPPHIRPPTRNASQIRNPSPTHQPHHPINMTGRKYCLHRCFFYRCRRVAALALLLVITGCRVWCWCCSSLTCSLPHMVRRRTMSTRRGIQPHRRRCRRIVSHHRQELLLTCLRRRQRW